MSVDASLLKEVDDHIKAVRDKSADRLLRLAYENSRSKILLLLEAGRKQLNCQPVKYSSHAHVEKSLREYTVGIDCRPRVHNRDFGIRRRDGNRSKKTKTKKQ